MGWVVRKEGSLCFEDNDDRFYQQRWLVRSFGELGQGQREKGVRRSTLSAVISGGGREKERAEGHVHITSALRG